MSLEVAVRKRLGDFALDATFTSSGKVTALFGRSGAGKTTLVNVMAGLLEPDSGRIAIDGTALVDTEHRIFLPVHKRRVGYVFQEGRLFPHLSVRSNLLYGCRAGEPARGESLRHIVELLGIADLLGRRPATLSGGEKQRVAVGRALLAEPRLLLLDEPLAALDEERKAEILPYLERLTQEAGLPIVYVSHAIDEVAQLADTVVLLSEGKVAATGAVNDVLSRLDLPDIADRLDAGTVLTATVRANDQAEGVTRLDHPAGTIMLPLTREAIGTKVRFRVRARDVAIAIGDPGRISIRNRLAATITEIAAMPGGAVDVKLDAGGEPLVARITQDAAHELELAPGKAVIALIKSAALDR
jgi:molybdate transport system ATP-binding protein